MVRKEGMAVPAHPHHVTQRENRRQETFFVSGITRSTFNLWLNGVESASFAEIGWLGIGRDFLTTACEKKIIKSSIDTNEQVSQRGIRSLSRDWKKG